MKAQIAIEYLAIIGIVIAAISLMAAYIWQQNEISSRLQQANVAVNSIVTAADNLYAQGPGAKDQITVIFPSGYTSSLSSISDNRIVLKIYTPIGFTDVVGETKANVSGNLPAEEGLKVLTLETVNGYVNISSS